MSSIKVYLSSVSCNLELKNKQQRIQMILQSKKIPFESVDIAASQDEKDNMRMIANNPKALPPQICNGEKYCGDYDAFHEAVENSELEQFLQM